MAAPAVIAGSFADYRLIKSRSVLQLVIEIPVEAQAVAFDALGYPMPGIEIPVAVARLNPASPHDAGGRPLPVTRPAQQGAIHLPCEDTTGASLGHSHNALTPKARYAAMTAGEQAVQRAAMLPKDERFKVWVASEIAGGGARRMYAVTEANAADFIRNRCCGGKSRRLIAEDPEAMDKFTAIETAFKIAVGEIAEPR